MTNNSPLPVINVLAGIIFSFENIFYKDPALGRQHIKFLEVEDVIDSAVKNVQHKETRICLRDLLEKEFIEKANIFVTLYDDCTGRDREEVNTFILRRLNELRVKKQWNKLKITYINDFCKIIDLIYKSYTFCLSLIPLTTSTHFSRIFRRKRISCQRYC